MSIMQITKNIYVCDYCSKESESSIGNTWCSEVIERDGKKIVLHGCNKEHIAMSVLEFYKMDSWLDIHGVNK